ncbi:MAG: Hpt domain-containing protein [Clostridiaceae bacterium]|nr:Hpt domain-containing protein [Clostridiaceae bacterium]MCI9484601.1 Hpt domain-containing protein [Clostridiaceae bacterium]NBH77385.1 Hpt domain-containing protein [Clostridiaceae bacterium]NBI83879.1 Hpt domain-containing protein [Clostridiaceae bacterium]RKJ75073.1 Hpt domain-containing protein [Butyricicoccus sp. 1XD8-22]
MTLQECYAAMGGSYEDAIGRLRSEKLVLKFVLKFLDDGSFGLLCSSMESGDYAEAFRAAHTIKGVCQNLSFSRLSDSSARLTEALRGGKGEGADALLEEVRADYQATADAIRALAAGA